MREGERFVTPDALNSAPPATIAGSEAGSYFRLIDSCITRIEAQGPSRTCNESKEEETKETPPPPATIADVGFADKGQRRFFGQTCL